MAELGELDRRYGPLLYTSLKEVRRMVERVRDE